MKKRLALVGSAAAVLATTAFAVSAIAGAGSPANKAVAASSKTAVMNPNSNVTLMSATLRTSKPEDLILQVSAECSILTSTTVGGTGIATETSEARGSVRIWVEVDGKIVPIQDSSLPPQDPANQKAGDDTDKATFCDRLNRRTVTDTEDPNDDTDETTDFQQTKSANSFNWVRLNTGAGIHSIVVKGELLANATASRASAQAIVGNRTIVIEPTKMANDAVISDAGS